MTKFLPSAFTILIKKGANTLSYNCVMQINRISKKSSS